jgi:tetratricopeptide (TPR) repeat protein
VGALGLILWQCARDVQLWTAVPLRARSTLFRAADATRILDAGLQELGESLHTLYAVVAEPQGITDKDVSDACTAVAEWASARAYGETAICFAELAAAASPLDPQLATTAGRFARRAAMYERAQRWFECGIALARASADRTAYTEALLSWGNMAFQRGMHSEAKRMFVRAWRYARKYHLRRLGAAARHNLLALSIEVGAFVDAQDHAAAAFKLYGPKHPRLAYLAHDTAQLWSWQGYADLAFSVFDAALPFVTIPKERIKILANLGRAAAGAHNAVRFQEAWEGVMDQLHSSNEHLAEALVNIAEGAWLLGLRDRAMDAATRARDLSRARGEVATEAQALAVLHRLRTVEPRPETRAPPDEARALAFRLRQALEAQAAPR